MVVLETELLDRFEDLFGLEICEIFGTFILGNPSKLQKDQAQLSPLHTSFLSFW